MREFQKLIEGHLVCLRPVKPAPAMPGIRLVGELAGLDWPLFSVEVDGNLCVPLSVAGDGPLDAVFIQQFRSDRNEELMVRLLDGSVWDVEAVL